MIEMAEVQRILFIYLLVINVATFFTYGIDKWKAKKSKWRIRDRITSVGCAWR